MDIQDLNKQLKSLHARGVDLNQSYSKLFGKSSFERNFDQLDICLTPLQWACCNGDIALIKKLISYHFSRDDSNDPNSDNNYQDNLSMSLKECIEIKQEKCFELMLDLGANPLREIKTACGVYSTAFEEACESEMGPYLVHCLRRGYCSVTALIDLVTTAENSYSISEVLKLGKKCLSNPSYQAMINHCTPDKLMDACHWTNVKYLVDNIPGCKELIPDQIAKCKAILSQPIVRDLRFTGRGKILDKIDKLNECLGLTQFII